MQSITFNRATVRAGFISHDERQTLAMTAPDAVSLTVDLRDSASLIETLSFFTLGNFCLLVSGNISIFRALLFSGGINLMEAAVEKMVLWAKKILSNKALQRIIIELLREQVKRTPQTWDDTLVDAVSQATGNSKQEVMLRFSKSF